MVVYRFMSRLEFIELMRGETLYNRTIHKARTTSIGFCFLDYEKTKPNYSIRFLSGAIYPEVCVVFRTDKNLKKGKGIYAKPLTDEELERKINTMSPIELLIEALDFEHTDVIEVEEYSTIQYNSRDLEIVKWCDCTNYWNPEKWKWIEYGKNSRET